MVRDIFPQSLELVDEAIRTIAALETFILDKDMREWFSENNPWAMEEIARRLLEADQRNLWSADENRRNALKESYLELEGIMEEKWETYHMNSRAEPLMYSRPKM